MASLMESLLLYSLVVYFFYHLVANSDILARPRAAAVRALPSWMTYPLECPFCFAWWFTLIVTPTLDLLTTGGVSLKIEELTVAPVINYLIGLYVVHVTKPSVSTAPTARAVRATSQEEPPLIIDPAPIPHSEVDSITFWREDRQLPNDRFLTESN